MNYIPNKSFRTKDFSLDIWLKDRDKLNNELQKELADKLLKYSYEHLEARLQHQPNCLKSSEVNGYLIFHTCKINHVFAVFEIRKSSFWIMIRDWYYKYNHIGDISITLGAGGKCVNSNNKIAMGYFIPRNREKTNIFTGSNGFNNIQLLCQSCNSSESNDL